MTKLKTKELIEQMQNISMVQLKKRICGEQIGKGTYRDVYVLKSNPDYVVKIERNMSTAAFVNVTEWHNYINNQEWKWLSEWLAPCEIISTNGQIMIQQRVEHRKRKDYPKYVPAIFTDLKLKNFGWIGSGSDRGRYRHRRQGRGDRDRDCRRSGRRRQFLLDDR